ncbi:Cytochrome c oxidase-assembly factor COX23, mitochondrial [Vanrija pseudolonga]|uniref:Cytochrome c oxidase-assembly factor COX23, mitochondrial n=1 Tax=Vanrija pseudolonga TaxID=143232 RepID=A0AAF0YG58_9TREE|nr:Cytochrome c oxidase-assembly factor COX23, mitochondrial [Vanrija pseudolonga]
MAATPVPPSTTRTPLEYRPKPPSEDLKEPEDYKVKFKVHQIQNHKTVSKFSDPCEKASKASLQCLEQTRYNKGECYEYFKAYRECKAKWLEQRKNDRKNGV